MDIVHKFIQYLFVFMQWHIIQLRWSAFSRKSTIKSNKMAIFKNETRKTNKYIVNFQKNNSIQQVSDQNKTKTVKKNTHTNDSIFFFVSMKR